MRMVNVLRLLLAFGVGLVLAACSTTSNRFDPNRPLNPLLDDVASVIFAFDLPRGLGPAAGSLFTYDVANGSPEEHLRLVPLPADVDGLPAGLPPPGANRAYYLFAFSAADQQKIRDAQITAQLNNAVERMGFYPKFCSAGTADPRSQISIYAVLAGRNPIAFLNQGRLADLMKETGDTTLPACV
jgi:hypothetical protein